MTKKSKITAFSVFGVIGAIAVVIFIGRPASPLTLPTPNGYDDLLKASQAVAGKIDDASNPNQETLRVLVVTNAEALRLLRVGLARQCAVPTDAQITNFGSELIGLKSLARVLIAEGRLAEMDGRSADAARSYTDVIRFGNEISRGGLLINRLVGIACEGMGSSALVKLLNKLSCEQMRPILVELEKVVDTGSSDDRFSRAGFPVHLGQSVSAQHPRSLVPVFCGRRSDSRRGV
jgi:hypothetical protein